MIYIYLFSIWKQYSLKNYKFLKTVHALKGTIFPHGPNIGMNWNLKFNGEILRRLKFVK